MSKTKLFVIFSLPSVTAVTLALAPEDCPTMVSDVVKLSVLVRTYSIGLDISMILASALLEEPIILSPLVNVQVIVPSVSEGIVASVLDSSESRTATNLNASALPKEIVLSVGRVPKASVSPGLTFNFFIS